MLSSEVTSNGTQQIADSSVAPSTEVPGVPSSEPACTRQPRSSMARGNHWPTKPAPPVIRARRDMSARSPRGPVTLEISVDHHPDQLMERDLRLPAELFPCPACIRDEQVDLGGAK